MKNVCPIVFGSGSYFNEPIFKKNLDYSHRILDFMLAVILEKLNLPVEEYTNSEASFMYEELPMFSKRLNNR